MNITAQKNNLGQSLVEFLVALALTMLFLPALITGLTASREGKAQQNQRLEAVTLMNEAAEAIRVVREADWSAVSVPGTYHPAVSGSTWTLASDTENINGFTRGIALSHVQRNVQGEIVESGGTADPSTMKAYIFVSWNTPIPTSIDSTVYLTRYLQNASLLDTNEADFLPGTTNSTAVINASGGEITLEGEGKESKGNWCKPNLSMSTKDLPKSGVANTVSAIEGHILAGTGENAAGVSFAHVTIDGEDPPNATVAGTLDGYKTNDVFNELNYAYIATDNNKKEVVIINVSSPPYSEIGYFDAPGNGNGNSVIVSGNTGYMTSGSMLFNFDLTDKTGAREPIDPNGVSLAGTGTSVIISGSYAFVSIAGSSTELQIIDISDSDSLQVVDNVDVNGQGARDVFINADLTRAYLVTDASSNQHEFFIVDISKTEPGFPVLGSYEASGSSPLGVSVIAADHRAIMVGTGGEEYQVIDISDEANPLRCGGLNIDTGVRGIASVLEADGDAYSYIVTGDATSELKIIAGGPGNQYASTGDFTSRVFDQTASVAYNFFSAGIIMPVSTSLALQVAGADPVSGSCTGANYIYVGPDGTSSTNFTPVNGVLSGSIPLDDDGVGFENPARCFRYKAYLSTDDDTLTPQLSDFSLNYSP